MTQQLAQLLIIKLLVFGNSLTSVVENESIPLRYELNI